MSQRLFDQETVVGVFCDGFHPKTEKRKGGGEVEVIDLSLRIQTFTPELATTMIGDGLVKRTLFRHDDGEPLPNIKSVSFSVGVPRQLLTVYAASDVDVASFALDHVRITDLKVRTEKGVDGLALVFHATYGPADAKEMGQFLSWYKTQKFCRFDEAEPSLEFEADGDDEEGTDADQKAREVIDGRPAPMWDDEAADERTLGELLAGRRDQPGDEESEAEPETPVVIDKAARQRLHSHQSKVRTSKKKSAMPSSKAAGKKKTARRARA